MALRFTSSAPESFSSSPLACFTKFALRLFGHGWASGDGSHIFWSLFFRPAWMFLAAPGLSCVVKRGMLAMRKQFQILQAVIKSVTVLVMNYLGRKKISAKVLLHDVTMFKHLSWPILNYTTALMNPAFLVRLSPAKTSRSKLGPMFRSLLVPLFRHARSSCLLGYYHYTTNRIPKQVEVVP